MPELAISVKPVASMTERALLEEIVHNQREVKEAVSGLLAQLQSHPMFAALLR